MKNKSLNRKSRYLSMLLRHGPEKANLVLDSAGWTDVKTLLANTKFDMPTLEEIVRLCNKKRYEFNDSKTKIRARQGHSVEVDLGYEPQEPPEFLYHGTATRFLDTIMDEGLRSMNRHHVHLSGDLDTASTVGKRHGKLIILKVHTKRMVEDLGAKFYLTDNKVWLTDDVPPKYLEIT